MQNRAVSLEEKITLEELNQYGIKQQWLRTGKLDWVTPEGMSVHASLDLDGQHIAVRTYVHEV